MLTEYELTQSEYGPVESWYNEGKFSAFAWEARCNKASAVGESREEAIRKVIECQ